MGLKWLSGLFGLNTTQPEVVSAAAELSGKTYAQDPDQESVWPPTQAMVHHMGADDAAESDLILH